MSIIELLIAMTVLAVGMMGCVIMLLAGIQSDSRSKTDTAALVLDQEILEMFATLNNYPNAGTVKVYDCGLSTGNANAHSASLGQGAAPTGNGATLYTTTTAPLPGNVGDIDWTQATPTLATFGTAGYAMDYQTCNGDTYEVRWNVMEVNTNPNSRISLLTVSARQVAAAHSHDSMMFAVPTSLKTLIEQ
jgi:type II secretory pathway pseudopilin PulG